jgi:hypothetical protein
MSRQYSSSWDTIGNSAEPDILYYNASIVNNTTDDVNGVNAYSDPPIRFNETRDTALIKDASKYQFSIVRFIVNGANKDLPLFIPAIQSSTGQTNVNLTEYAVGLTWNGKDPSASTNVSIIPPLTYLIYVPETQNPVLAPLPRPTSSPNFVGLWNGAFTTAYAAGNIVSTLTSPLNPYDPFNYYVAIRNVPALPSTIPLSDTTYWQRTSSELGRSQDLSTRYYWVYTYQHWVDIVNTALDEANRKVWYEYSVTYGFGGYGTFAAWKVAFPSPKMIFNPASYTFSMYFPTCYLPVEQQNTLITPPTPPNVTPQMWCFFNVNMEGLFANFNNLYWNNPTANNGFPFPYPPTALPASAIFPIGYANQMVVQLIGLNDNLITFPSSGTTPNWVIITQDYASTSTLWSPIESIVFTSTLLPLQNEQTAPPNVLGTGNIGQSAATSQSAFSPIITDVALDLSSDPSGYRKMIYYSPVAEYRMADFQNSKQDIRSIDIQVYWKNRLDNQLYPISMFNLSSVSIKVMFRKKEHLAKSEQMGAGRY